MKKNNREFMINNMIMLHYTCQAAWVECGTCKYYESTFNPSCVLNVHNYTNGPPTRWNNPRLINFPELLIVKQICIDCYKCINCPAFYEGECSFEKTPRLYRIDEIVKEWKRNDD